MTGGPIPEPDNPENRIEGSRAIKSGRVRIQIQVSCPIIVFEGYFSEKECWSDKTVTKLIDIPDGTEDIKKYTEEIFAAEMRKNYPGKPPFGGRIGDVRSSSNTKA